MEIVVEILSVLDLWDIHWFLYFRIPSTCRCDGVWTSTVFLWKTAGTTHPGNGPFLPDRNGHVYHSIETLELAIIGTCRCIATTATHRVLYFFANTLKESLSCLVEMVSTIRTYLPSSTKPKIHEGEGVLERQEK